MSNDPDICGRCAEEGHTCCRVSLKKREFLFPLSPDEKEAIVRHVGGGRIFCHTAENTPDFISSLKKLFPGNKRVVGRLFVPGGAHESLAVDEQGRCCLLSETGCILPREARPFYCKLYPFWVVNGKVTLLDSNECRVQVKYKKIGKIMSCLDMNSQEILTLFSELKKAWHIDD